MAKKADKVWAANFKRWHAKSGLTHAEIAEQAGVSIQAVQSWAKGIRVPMGPNLAALCRIFRATPDELLRGTDHGNGQKEKPKRGRSGRHLSR